MPPTYNDGGLNYGTRTESLTPVGGGAPTVYVMESVTFTRKVNRLEQFDNLGAPLRAAGIPKFNEGTCTAQLAASNTRIPQSGDTFADTFDAAVGAVNFIVHEVGQVEGQMDPRKVNITFYQKYN